MLSTEFNALPVLETPRLRLRPLTPADVPALFTIFSDPGVMRYWSSAPLADEAAAAALLAQIQEEFATGGLFQWGIARVLDNLVIGTCSVRLTSPQNRRADVGYALGSAHWGHGYATEALEQAIRFAFTPAETGGGLGLLRLEADIDPRNAASARVLERQHFRREGYLRERWHVNGEVCDTLLYGLLAREWLGETA